jgi:hypothetical protein
MHTTLNLSTLSGDALADAIAQDIQRIQDEDAKFKAVYEAYLIAGEEEPTEETDEPEEDATAEIEEIESEMSDEINNLIIELATTE